MPDRHLAATVAKAPEFDSGLVWFRRDLRVDDHAALFHALRQCRKVYCVFVFDTAWLDPLPRTDRRVEFIRQSLVALDADLRRLAQQCQAPAAEAAGLMVLHGPAAQVLVRLAVQLGVQAVFANRDYAPDAIACDNQIRGMLANAGISMRTSKDHVLFEHDEVPGGNGQPVAGFASYYRAWLARITPFYLRAYPCEARMAHLAPRPAALQRGVPGLADIGFLPTNLARLRLQPGSAGADAAWTEFFERITHYHLARDYPATKGPSYLGVHMRFGTISIRRVARMAHALHLQGNPGAGKWLQALAQRDFHAAMLARHPHLTHKSFMHEGDAIRWDHSAHGKKLFAAWCAGQTGYPLVDAGMRQLHGSGYMHQRLRMVAASFLVKQLGVDWRWGERHFAEHLNDYDLASNVGNWQWAAGTGCDAQPWFHLVDPVAQSQQYDAQGKFLRRYLPELAGLPDAAVHAPWRASASELQAAGIVLGVDYPKPIVDPEAMHAHALQRHAAQNDGDRH